VNLLSGISAAGAFVSRITSTAAKKVAAVARREFDSELAGLDDAVQHVRTAVSEGTDMARGAAADAIAKGAAKAGVATAARVGPRGNVYERAVAYFGTPEKRRRALIIAVVGLVVVVVIVGVYVIRRKR